jgi:quinol monooxygenase YgiN
MAENSVRVVARITAKPDKVSELRTILSSLIEPTQKEKGCIRYEMLENRSDPTDFTFVEEWSDDLALETHLNSLQSSLPKVMEFVAEPPEIRTYSVVA